MYFYVYILGCSDKKTYIGCTNNLKSRLIRHSKGYVAATKRALPVKLLAYFAFKNEKVAYKFEKYLKTGSGRAFLSRHLL